ncbi:MAG: CCA tRNA nucleotidyltransferase [Kordiimonadaceae bacterium]|nr:CCA tRNA nucleotidyltransferase [Kordiimonadaceae bacterium]MBT6031730.1 CCA tRNA nucleotidyltransferase [Kordiimonadaceae bacterium]
MQIKNQTWLNDPDLQQVMGVLNKYGTKARIVGGAVRDALMGFSEIGDIDIASALTPEQNMDLLESPDIKVYPTGIQFGTITAVINDKTFEITTLRQDVDTDGRHAQVEFTDDWLEDAKRRDFTFNALYLDMDGTVHDPLNGYQDLLDRRVRFIGAPLERIKEDALRILRFYRFFGEISSGNLDDKGHEAAKSLKSDLRGLSGERVWQEFRKILLSNNAPKVLKIMCEAGILYEILPENEGVSNFCNYFELENSLNIEDDIGRLSCLLPYDQEIISDTAKKLRLSNKQSDVLSKYGKEYPYHDLDQKTLRRVMYETGKDILIHYLCLRGKLTKEILEYIQSYKIPLFSIQGKDLIIQGWAPGVALGLELNRLEKKWIESDFKSLKN